MIDSTTDGEASAPLKSICPRTLYLVVIELFNLPAMLKSSDVLPDPDGPLPKQFSIRLQNCVSLVAYIITLIFERSKVMVTGFKMESRVDFEPQNLRLSMSSA